MNVKQVKIYIQGVKAREAIVNGPKRRVSIDSIVVYPMWKYVYPFTVNTNIRRLKMIHGQDKQTTHKLRGLPTMRR